MSELGKIKDAQAFTVGMCIKVHAPKSYPSSITVVGRCGVVAYTDYFNTYPENFTGHDVRTHPAYWADSDITCPTCRDA